MTKKDHKLLASAIAEYDWDSQGEKALFIVHLADHLVADNVRFNRTKFYEAAGQDKYSA